MKTSNSFNQMRESLPNIKESNEDINLKNMYNEFNNDQSETSWELSKTAFDESNNINKNYDKLDTIREEINSHRDNDELIKPRFEQHYIEIEENKDNIIEEDDELSSTIIES